MSGKLFEARKMFVENVSSAVLKQLLDDLVDVRVLNEEENDSIREEYSTRTDKARQLIDIVRRKGDSASNHMIKAILNRDPNLYEELALTSSETHSGGTELGNGSLEPPPQMQNQGEIRSSDILKLSTPQFRARIVREGEKMIYMPRDKTTRRRLALLITNVKFDHLKLRRGAEKDEEQMEKLLKGLDYEVVKYRDLSGQAMDTAVRDFSRRKEHTESDSTFVVIMSHGQRDKILGVHWSKEDPDTFDTDNIYKHLNTQGCPGLRNKPKVILIQACRGVEKGGTWVSDDIQSDSATIESDDHLEHKEKDFISLLSCTPDTVSYRDVEKGSFCIQYLVEEINTHAHQDHIEELFTKVMRRFEEFPRQMVCKERTTLSRHFYLFPGH